MDTINVNWYCPTCGSENVFDTEIFTDDLSGEYVDFDCPSCYQNFVINLENK